MTIPVPEIGLIIEYSFVFPQATRSIGLGGKNRPCLIVSVFPDRDEPAKTSVLLLPITHTEPTGGTVGVELSADVRFAAGLDGRRQWVLVSFGNLDTWPEDVFPLPGRPGQFAYGVLPPSSFALVQAKFRALYAAKRFNIVPRDVP
jgi:hypothetical protein